MIARHPHALLQKALHGRYAIGAFNVNNLELLQGIIRGAEKTRAPVILQTSEGAIVYAGMEELVAMMTVAAKRATVPCVIHLDHGKDLAVVREAIRSGYTSVMYDGSALPYEENVANTTKVVRWAHAKSIMVEAELGALTGTEDLVSVEERAATYTIPEQALDFVERTGCDALAVAIGTAHGAYKLPASPNRGVEAARSPTLDIPRLRRIHALLPDTPLVLHGASAVSKTLVHKAEHLCSMLDDCHRLAGAHGIPDAQVRQAIRYGIAKVNTDTDLRIAFTAGLREALVTHVRDVDPRTFLAPARDEVARVVTQRIRVFGGARKTRN